MRLAATRTCRVCRLMVSVKHVGIEVCSVWPCNRPDLRIYVDLGEEIIVVGQSYKCGAPQEWREVNYPFGPVGESQAYDSVMKNLDVCDIDPSHSYGNGSMVPGGWWLTARSQHSARSTQWSRATR